MQHTFIYRTPKKFFLPTLLLLSMFLSLSLSSCENDDYYSRKLNYGTVVNNTGPAALPVTTLDALYILRDDGARLVIEHTRIPHDQLTTGLRLIAEYTILKDITPMESSGPPMYTIRLHSAYNVLSKDPVRKSEEADPSKLGKDPLSISRAWVSVVGDFAYMNIDFYYPRYSPHVIHYINFWINDDDMDTKNWQCELRHDAKGDYYPTAPEHTLWDRPSFGAFGRVSFKIKDYIDYGDEEFAISFNDGQSEKPRFITVKVNEHQTASSERFAENFETYYN
jgi:hypothetical protein